MFGVKDVARANLKINKLLFLQLVGHLLYLCLTLFVWHCDHFPETKI